MTVKKILAGLYHVYDDLNNHYRIEDSSKGYLSEVPPPEGSLPWCVWEQEEGDWFFLDSNNTMADCLEFIQVIEAAHELGK
jgi:hypothetical protein